MLLVAVRSPEKLPVIEPAGFRGPACHLKTASSSGATTGSFCNTRASARLNTAAVEPMPIASDSTETTVKTGDRPSSRRP